MAFLITIIFFKKAKSGASNHFQLLDSHFLDHEHPNLVSHPGWHALGLVHLHPLAYGYMHLLCAPLAESDVRVAPVGRLRAAWRAICP